MLAKFLGDERSRFNANYLKTEVNRRGWKMFGSLFKGSHVVTFTILPY